MHANMALQLHAIIVDVLQSEVKCKKIHHLIQKFCASKHHHLIPVHSMKILWNMTYAEILCGIDLKPVGGASF